MSTTVQEFDALFSLINSSLLKCELLKQKLTEDEKQKYAHIWKIMEELHLLLAKFNEQQGISFSDLTLCCKYAKELEEIKKLE